MPGILRISDGKPGCPGRYDATLRDDAILEIVIRHVWTAEQVDQFFEELRPLHIAARRRHGRVRTFVRVEDVQSPVIAMRVRENAIALKREGDRNAFLVATFLSKLQIKRLATNENFGLFTDAAAAEAWLKEA